MNLTKISPTQISRQLAINFCTIPFPKIALKNRVCRIRKQFLLINNNQKTYYSTVAAIADSKLEFENKLIKKMRKPFRIPVPLNASEMITVPNCQKNLIKHAKDTYKLVG